MVSVIIPVYKSEKTLKRCVESVLAQAYSDLELLLIVDGPPDGSGILAERLALTDSRIRVINQSNQGVSKARNKGIEEARGEYIRFLDSDDYLKGDAIGCMVEAIEREKSDMVIAGYEHLYYGQVIPKRPKRDGVLRVKEDYEGLKELYEGGFLNMPWNKLFRRERIAKGFQADVSLGEDLMFNQDYILRSNTISVLRDCVCEYIQDERGTTLSSKKRDDRIETALGLYQSSKDFFQTLYPDRQRFDFLDEKVITTFLDDVELLGFAKMPRKERRGAIAAYADATRHFLKEQTPDICLRLLDYKVIYFFLRRHLIGMTDFCIWLRTLVVKLARRLGMKSR